MSEYPDPRSISQASFHTTQWELVRQAGDSDSDEGREALERFCEAYWYPLYAYLRRRGMRPEDSADLVQGFFADFLTRESLRRVEREGGRLRAYLLAALRNFVSNERARAGAWKRGGGVRLVSIERESAEERFGVEPVDGRTPERTFERSWALTILERALTRLGEEQQQRGRAELFARLAGWLSGNPPEGGLATIAAQTNLSTGALRVALHRLRRRYRELLRQEVRATLGPEDDVDRELDLLLEALGEEGE